MSPNASTPSVDRRERVTEAVLEIVDQRGLQDASVREVAALADVSIGTVQHYFPTKDAMLRTAFEEVVGRIRARIEAIPLGDDLETNLRAVLRELLPLHAEAASEVRTQLAFNARAMTDPALAQVQRATLTQVHGELAAAFSLVPGATERSAQQAAHLMLALVDGLALHAVVAGGWLSSRQQEQTLDQALALALDAAGRGGTDRG